jgi:hypothetical protein
MTTFSPLKAAEFRPISLQSPNPWVGHLPFAYWIMGAMRPKIFVELGTHSGNSYFAFCQSTKELHLPTQCYAVDTWQGDMHAGRYDDTVYNEVNAHNKTHYGEFSHLLRMTFDEALSKFTNGSINLLHIDGLHTYEAVKHDFDTWLPKLAPNAIVLFHDTEMRDHGFGVWKLWAELREKFNANLSFPHSKGLGVICITSQSNPSLASWLSAPEFTTKQVLDYFTALGERQLEVFNMREDEMKLRLNHEVSVLSKELADRDTELSELRQWINSWKLLLKRGLNLLIKRIFRIKK